MAAGCATYGSDPKADLLSGTWNWVRSTGGLAAFTYTPASEHYTVQFKFENGRLSVLRNDSLKATTTYSADGTVTYEPAISVFRFDPQMEQHTFRALQGDTISLADPCCDRYEHVFVRAR